MNWYKKSQINKFYHGSFEKLPAGTILNPRGSDYIAEWENTDFYSILEKYRPPNMLAHYEAVFMCDNIDDVGLTGGAERYIYEVVPLGKVEKHDVNWSSEISRAVSDNESEEKLEKYATNYWEGVPHTDENVWEYLTPSIKIKKLVYSEGI